MENKNKRIGCNISLSASHPVNGAFYTVRFSDGKLGHVNMKNAHAFVIQRAGFRPIDGIGPFPTMEDAVLALHETLSKDEG